MNSPWLPFYDALVLRRPWLSLLLVALLTAAIATQLGKIKLDASADSLMLQGDPSLDVYRQVSSEYATEDFVLITWQPYASMLSPQYLQRDESYFELLKEREGLRSKRSKVALSPIEAEQLAGVEAAFKARSAIVLKPLGPEGAQWMSGPCA